ncbi:MAG: hypothetical protein PVI71_16445 [Desulfobacterales bacterium]
MNFWWMGCGQKGSPRPPLRPVPAAVKDLSYVIYNQIVELSWTFPGAEDRSASPPAGYKVFRSKWSAEESSCEKCPLTFNEVGNIPIPVKQSHESKAEKLRFTESLEPGYHYVYKVIVYDEDGISSKDSNAVEFDH